MSGVGQAALASLVAVGIAVVAPVATLGSGDGFVHQSKAPAPLLSRTTYIVPGTKTADGGHYTYPGLRLRASETTRVQRDVGIDQANCRKLVEEGVPTTSEAAPGADARISQPVGHQSGTTRAGISEVGHSGFTKIWWVDQPGYLVNQDETIISWIVSGSCVTQGNASGDWEWRSGTGWQIVSYGGTDDRTCTRYKGETWATYKNPVFCVGQPTVYTYYYYVRAYGWSTGNPWITGTWSSDSVNDCLTLYERHQVSQTG